jgi:hypothetical protein
LYKTYLFIYIYIYIYKLLACTFICIFIFGPYTILWIENCIFFFFLPNDAKRLSVKKTNYKFCIFPLQHNITHYYMYLYMNIIIYHHLYTCLDVKRTRRTCWRFYFLFCNIYLYMGTAYNNIIFCRPISACMSIFIFTKTRRDANLSAVVNIFKLCSSPRVLVKADQRI